MESKYFTVAVKLEEEVGYKKNGDPKIKKSTETYIVRASTPQAAVAIAEKEMEACVATWRIHSAKETKITGILG